MNPEAEWDNPTLRAYWEADDPLVR